MPFTGYAISIAADSAFSVFATEVDGDANVLSTSISDDKIAWYENATPLAPTVLPGN